MYRRASSFISNNDGYFIELTRRHNKSDFSTRRIKSSQQLVRGVSNYPFIVPSVIIDRRITLARFSGLEVRKDIIKQGKFLSLQQCKGLCENLAELYFNGVYMKDIHPGNMVVANEHASVKFIDTVDAVHPESRFALYECGCPNYFTLALTEGRENGDYDLIRIGEQYSLALTVCYITDKTEFLRDAIKEHKWKNEKGLGCNCYTDPRYMLAFDDWINENIQPEYHNAFRRLLRSPEKVDPSFHVSNMFNWTQEK